jgi:sarcosine oxidase/L-pipecolate oxidase
VKNLLFDQAGDCIGVASANGSTYHADVVILATGAQTGSLINAENELTAKAMCIATVQLTPEEAAKYRSLPMVDHFEQGK